MAKKTKLTKRIIDNAESKGKRYLIQDSEIPGFALKVEPTGSKSYIITYRTGGRESSQRTYNIGKCNALTVDQARKEAQEVYYKVRRNEDPQGELRNYKNRTTFSDLYERYLDEIVKSYNKPKTCKEKKRCFEKYFQKSFGNKEVKNISKQDIIYFHTSYRDTPYLANRLLSYLSNFFNSCIDWELITVNPCFRVRKYKEYSRERFLSEDELERLLSVLDSYENSGYFDVNVIIFFRLIIYTGARLEEISTAKYEYLKLEKEELHLPDSKTGKKIIYLNKEAIEEIGRLEKIPGNPYLIPSRIIEGKHISPPKKVWNKIREDAKIEDVTIHDLRHAFATFAASARLTLTEVGKLLSHKSPQTTQIYTHLLESHKNKISDKVSSEIKSYNKKNRSKVVQLKTAKR